MRYTLRNFLKKNLLRWKNGKRKFPQILHVKPLNEGFVIAHISFSSLLASSFGKFVWSYLSILPTTKHVQERRKQQKRNHLSVLDDQNKILVGFKVQC